VPVVSARKATDARKWVAHLVDRAGEEAER
jgi:hypothetical protein